MSYKDQEAIMGRQIAAARTLLALSQNDLAAAAAISVPTLKRMEASEGMASGMPNNVRAVRAALEAAGIEFIPENGGGAGVRFRMRADGTRDEH
ncbi:transcriptional regulator [Methylobacterium oryzisoli]|uniref:transcriptional regulator n=1 Tax=Methylobacterium oryzisoli TaxID=3385502 RepID=UPI00389295A1